MTVSFRPRLLNEKGNPRRRQVYAGVEKTLFEGPEPSTYVMYFKDDVSDGVDCVGSITGKGVMNNRISEKIMTQLDEIGIETHFISPLNMREQLVHRAETFPFQVAVHNYATGAFAERLDLDEETPLQEALVEFLYKSGNESYCVVSSDHITVFEWATEEELTEMVATARRVNDFLLGYFMAIGIRFASFALEFGRIFPSDQEEGRIAIIDEISPDTCRLWDMETGEALDKSRFLNDLGRVEEAYQEVARRLGVLPKNGEMTENVFALKDRA